MTVLGDGIPLSFFQIDVAELVKNPYPVYRQLREHSPRLVTPDGLLVLSRYRDCVAVLRDPRWDVAASYSCTSRQGVETGNDTFAGLRDIFAPGGDSDVDDGSDTELRRLRLIGRAFARRTAMSFAEPMRELVDGLIDDGFAAGRVDLVDAFARPVVDTFFCQLLGVPYTDRVLFHRWAFDLTRVVDPVSTLTDDDVARIHRSGAELREYVSELVGHRRAATDLFSTLAEEAAAEGDPVSERELVATCSMLLIAGSTSVDFLSLAARALIDHPEQRAALAADPEAVPVAVEELLRYTSPIQFTIRAAREDHDLDGLPVTAGQQAIVLLAAANRDPEVFPEPDRLDLRRHGEPHVAFSHGRHHCLGAQFARVQGSIALSTLASRVPELAADGDVEFKHSFVSRSMSSLPVTFGRPADHR